MSSSFSMNRRIGSTNYTINVFASDTAAETLEDILLRLIRNKEMESGERRERTELPQMSRQSERSA